MVNHTWNPFTDLSGTPSHSATIRDVLLPTIQGRLEVQEYATTAALPAAGDYIGQQAYTTNYGVMWWWTGTVWRVLGTPSFADTTARDAAIPSPLVGDQCMVGTDEYRCLVAGAWTLWMRPKTEWTPIITGITGGLRAPTGSEPRCWYAVSAGVMSCHISLTCTGALTGSNLRISGLPLPIVQGVWGWVSRGVIAPGTRYPADLVRFSTPTELAVFYANAAGSMGAEITASVPAAWAAKSDAVTADFTALLA